MIDMSSLGGDYGYGGQSRRKLLGQEQPQYSPLGPPPQYGGQGQGESAGGQISSGYAPGTLSMENAQYSQVPGGGQYPTTGGTTTTGGNWWDQFTQQRQTDPYASYTVPGYESVQPAGQGGGGGGGGQQQPLYNMPEEWTAMTPWAKGMLNYTGNAVDTSGLFAAQEPIMQRQMNDLAMQAAESAGMGGMRYSTPLQRNIAQGASQLTENMGLNRINAGITSQENAANRMLQGQQAGASSLFGLGQGRAGLEENALQRQMQSAAAGAAAGNAESARELQMLQMLYGMGGDQGQAGNVDWSNQYNVWNAGQGPSAWDQMALQYGSTQQPQYAQTTYQPSTLSTMLGTAANVLPYIQQNKRTTSGGGSRGMDWGGAY